MDSEIVQSHWEPSPPPSEASPMDYSPVTSPESDDTKESTFLFESPVSGVRDQGDENSRNGKAPMKLQLSRKGDKVWKWVKHAFPSKRKAQMSMG